MKFAIGDTVVHPQHGVGCILNVEEKQFVPKISRTYYVVSIIDATLWVPVDLETSGLRRLSAMSDLDQCRQILQSAPRTLKSDRGLLGSLSAQVRQGTLDAHCEVVRDLAAFSWHKSLFGPLADFQRLLMDVLCQEWAVVSEKSETDVFQEISGLLRKCRAAHEQE